MSRKERVFLFLFGWLLDRTLTRRRWDRVTEPVNIASPKQKIMLPGIARHGRDRQPYSGPRELYDPARPHGECSHVGSGRPCTHAAEPASAADMIGAFGHQHGRHADIGNGQARQYVPPAKYIPPPMGSRRADLVETETREVSASDVRPYRVPTVRPDTPGTVSEINTDHEAIDRFERTTGELAAAGTP